MEKKSVNWKPFSHRLLEANGYHPTSSEAKLKNTRVELLIARRKSCTYAKSHFDVARDYVMFKVE